MAFVFTLGPTLDGKRLQSTTKSTALRIGTRGSPLAQAQAHEVRWRIALATGLPEDDFEIITIRTLGDDSQAGNVPLSGIGGKGLFSKEIEAALIEGAIDLAVHSAKDMATVLPDGLVMPVFLEREDTRDAFISLIAARPEDLPDGARLGTSSIRRAAQFRRFRPDLKVIEYRGNVGTRLQKLADGVADATVLAAAGLRRLGLADTITSLLDPETFPPAPAQGAIGLEIREGDAHVFEMIAQLNHDETRDALLAERAMLLEIDGSCKTPIAARTRRDGDRLTLFGQVMSPDGRACFEAEESSAADEAEALGHSVGRKLIAQAGPALLAALDRR
jgi:hydroxymethylbilane synthase